MNLGCGDARSIGPGDPTSASTFVTFLRVSRLYSLKFNLIGWPDSPLVRSSTSSYPNCILKHDKLTLNHLRIYDDMCYLIDKYPPISLGEQPTKSGFAAAATGVVISISG